MSQNTLDFAWLQQTNKHEILFCGITMLSTYLSKLFLVLSPCDDQESENCLCQILHFALCTFILSAYAWKGPNYHTHEATHIPMVHMFTGQYILAWPVDYKQVRVIFPALESLCCYVVSLCCYVVSLDRLLLLVSPGHQLNYRYRADLPLFTDSLRLFAHISVNTAVSLISPFFRTTSIKRRIFQLLSNW